jgi:hypothetical protein
MVWLSDFSDDSACQSKSHIATDGQSISKSWCWATSGSHDQMFITLWQLRSSFLGRPLWREDGFVVSIYCLSSPAKSFSDPSTLAFVTIFYRLRFETFLSSPLTTRKVTVEVFDPPPHGCSACQNQSQSHWLTVSQSVCLGVEPHLELMTRY